MRAPITQQQLSITPNLSLHEALQQQIGKGLLRPQTYWLKVFAGDIALDFIGRFGQAGGETVQIHQHIHGKQLLNGSVARLPDNYFDTCF